MLSGYSIEPPLSHGKLIIFNKLYFVAVVNRWPVLWHLQFTEQWCIHTFLRTSQTCMARGYFWNKLSSIAFLFISSQMMQQLYYFSTKGLISINIDGLYYKYECLHILKEKLITNVGIYTDFRSWINFWSSDINGS